MNLVIRTNIIFLAFLADGACGGKRSVTKTDIVTITAASGTETKLVKIRVAWGSWSQVYVSMDCSYTVTSAPYSPPPTVNTPAAAVRLTGLGLPAFLTLLVLLLSQL